MKRVRLMLMMFVFCLFICTPIQAETRALLLACHSFVSQPSLGYSASGNLQTIGAALYSGGLDSGAVAIEDGTISTRGEFASCIEDFFFPAKEKDLSILYICTHGITEEDSGSHAFILSDGSNEERFYADDLYHLLTVIPGEKLLILDACYSGAVIGRCIGEQNPFASDPSIHVLTSSSGNEAAWYYGYSESMEAVSYFSSALCAGIGMYGRAESDQNADGTVTLTEIYDYLSASFVSSSVQLYSLNPDSLLLPVVKTPLVIKPITAITYGRQHSYAANTYVGISYTINFPVTIQYRIIEHQPEKGWNWQQAHIVNDSEFHTHAGRRTLSLPLPSFAETTDAFILQIFAVNPYSIILCSEKLFPVYSAHETDSCHIQLIESLSDLFIIHYSSNSPAVLSVSVMPENNPPIPLYLKKLVIPGSDNTYDLFLDCHYLRSKGLLPGKHKIIITANQQGHRSFYEFPVETHD